MRIAGYGFWAFLFLTGCNSILGLTAGEPGAPSGGSSGSGGAAGAGGGYAGGSGGGAGGVAFGPEVEVAGSQAAPRGIAVDLTHIYWVNFGDGTVNRATKDTFAVQEIANNQDRPSVIALSPTSSQVYWATHDPIAIRRAPRMGGMISDVFVPGWLANAEGLVVTDSDLFWTNDSTEIGTPNWEIIARVSNLAATTFIPIAEDQNGPRGLAHHDGFIYWTSFEGGWIRRVSGSVGPMAPNELIFNGASMPYGVAADATHVYWTEQGRSGVFRLAHTDYQTMPEEIAAGQGDASAIVLDDTHVYWTNLSGAVRARAKSGGQILEIAADNTGNGRSIAVDGDGVYWVDTLGGRVVMAPRL